MKTTRPFWLIASNITAMIAFTISTVSPFGFLLVAGYALALLQTQKMPRDSANIWGLRLFIYAMGAVLGRAASAGQFTFYDARMFLTVGLILGGELILQTLREPPRGLRYDPAVLLLSGLLFLIACNTLQLHIFVMAPLYVFTLVMAMNQNRVGARSSALATATRVGIVTIAVFIGAGLHSTLWLNRSQIMAAGAKLLSSGNYQSSAESAEMGDNPQLGSSFAQGASTARLMRVRGNLGDAHLRGAAFDLYSNGTWGPTLSSRLPLDPALPRQTKENVGEGNSGDPRTDTDATITMLRPSDQVIYAPLNIYAIVPGAGVSGFDWDRYAGPIKNDSETLPVRYGIINSKRVVDGVELTQGPLCVAPNAAQRVTLLQVPPEIQQGVKDLTLDATIEAPTQPEKIIAIVNYLQANHSYSLDFAREEGDPVSEFLLSKKSAHCQYFAASAVMMMRIAGIPARYVSGFYAHETEDNGDIIVRGRDAHAWAEAYVDNVGWVSVDATPAAGRADPAANPLPFYQKPLENLIDWWGRVRAWFSRLTTLQILAMMSVVLAIWGAERYRQSWRKSRRAARAATVPVALAPLARRFEKSLARRGITLSPGVPWSESLPPDWEREARWIALYNRLRFARGDDDELRELARELDELEREKTKIQNV